MLKRTFDLFLALILLAILIVPMGLIGLFVLFSMGRPVIFRQVRPGYRAKPFMMMKFRTMKDERGPDGILLADELRLTRVGRILRQWSLDELPQLFNVLQGNLSFVGPRPLLMQYLPLYSEYQARRHEVKPGITGWTQVNGRNALTWEEKFDLDIWYVDHKGFTLDMKILLMTVVKIIKKEGIAAEGSETMPEFKGSGIRVRETSDG